MLLQLLACTIFLLLILATNSCSTQPVAILQTPSTTTTTAIVPAIEDPIESAETTSEASSEEYQYRCFKCYNQITDAQKIIAFLEHLKEKEKKLIREKSSSLSRSSLNNPTTTTKKPKITRHSSNSNSTAPTFRSSIPLDDGAYLSDSNSRENKQIVVSRLRVARSTTSVGSDNGSGIGFIPSLTSMRNSPKNNIVDPELKKLKLKQEQQYNKTCKVLNEVKQCFSELTSTCIGNLQFHAMEVYQKQWESIYSCSFKASFGSLVRTLPTIEEKPKDPIARPISSQEETSRRIETMLGRNTSPLGVMLKPTLSKLATNRYNSLKSTPDQQLYSTGQTKGVNPMKVVSPYNGIQVPITGQLLFLIICFALAVVALIAISLRFFKTNQTKV